MEYKNLEKRVFPGGNTSKGFHSFYEYLIEPTANKIIVLKGGPGVGKSTFMKKIAEAMQNNGYSIEFHHCSSDPDSLDGIVMPALNIAIVDGTSPHVVDPRFPGSVDEILHLGDFWDEKALISNKDKIIDTTRDIEFLFKRAYRFLKAAKNIYDDWKALNSRYINTGLANKKIHDLIKEILSDMDISLTPGKTRHLFASAITPDGLINYLDTIICQAETRYIIQGHPGTGKTTLINRLAEACTQRGIDVELYHCALDPEKIEHILIPQISTALTTYIDPHKCEIPCKETINMNECFMVRDKHNYKVAAEKDEALVTQMLNTAVSILYDARATHDDLEKYYIPAMNFDRIEMLRKKTFKRILKYT